jgi:hypothetical protein
MAEHPENDRCGITQSDFSPGAYDWLLTTFVAPTHGYYVAHAVALNFLLTFDSLSYDTKDLLSEQIGVTPDAR